METEINKYFIQGISDIICDYYKPYIQMNYVQNDKLDKKILDETNFYFFINKYKYDITDIYIYGIFIIKKCSNLFKDSSIRKIIIDGKLKCVGKCNHMFFNTKYFDCDLHNMDTSGVTDMSFMFYYSKIFNGFVDNWNTSRVKDMSFMFSNTDMFNRDLKWNTSRVRDMSFMFSNTKKFNGDIENWYTQNVRYMNNMFLKSSSFNRDIGYWNTKNVRDMSYMFSYSKKFDQNINYWNISSLRNIKAMFYMSNCKQNSKNKLKWNMDKINIKSFIYM